MFSPVRTSIWWRERVHIQSVARSRSGSVLQRIAGRICRVHLDLWGWCQIGKLAVHLKARAWLLLKRRKLLGHLHLHRPIGRRWAKAVGWTLEKVMMLRIHVGHLLRHYSGRDGRAMSRRWPGCMAGVGTMRALVGYAETRDVVGQLIDQLVFWSTMRSELVVGERIDTGKMRGRSCR